MRESRRGGGGGGGVRAWQGSVAGAWKLEAGFGRRRGEKGSQTEVGRSERLSRLLKRIVFRKALPSSPVALPVGRTAAEPASRLGRRATRLSQGRKDGRKALRDARRKRKREREMSNRNKKWTALFSSSTSSFFLAAPSFYIFAWEEKHEIESNRQVSRIQGHYIKKEHRGGRTRL